MIYYGSAMKKHFVITIVGIIVTLLALIPASSQQAQTNIEKTQSCWKLVKTEHYPLDKTEIKDNERGKVFFDVDDHDGRLECKYYSYSREGKNADDLINAGEAFISWNPPPPQAKTSETWDGGYLAKILRDDSYYVNSSELHKQLKNRDFGKSKTTRHELGITLDVNVSFHFVSEVKPYGGAGYATEIGITTQPGIKKKSNFIFPNKDYPDYPYLVILLDADFRVALGVEAASRFNYFYEWMPCKPTETKKNLPTTSDETKSHQTAEVKAPCKEASFYYDADDIQNTYTGERSLNFEREQLVTDMIAAIQKYEQEGGTATAGIRTLDAPYIAMSFDSGALPTDREDFLRTEIREMFQRKQGKLSPGEVFYCALKATKGNVRDALVTAHAVLYRDKPGMNTKLINKYLEPLRNPDGYLDQKTLKVYNEQKKSFDYVSAKQYAGNDQQGAWYHLFGMAALEFTDRQGLTPLEIFQAGAEIYKPDKALPLDKGFPMSEVCGKVSNYAIALENQVRLKGYRRPPDPDKQCVNFTGAAIGTALAKYMSLPTKRALLSKLMKIETRRQWRTNMDYAYLIKSPVSFMLSGTNDEEFSFNQTEKIFSGNTDLAYVEPLPEENGTWGLFVIPFFKVQNLRMDAVDQGKLEFVIYDYNRKGSRGYAIDAKKGDRYSISYNDPASVHELKNQASQIIKPVVDTVSPTTQMPVVKIFDNGNLDACSFTNTTHFILKKSVHITKFAIWYYWKPEETSIAYTVKQNNKVIHRGMFNKVSCDPHQNQWCSAEDSSGFDLSAGSFLLTIDNNRQCQNKRSNGNGILRIWGSDLDF
jgi:hypothetical protein